MNVPDTHSKDNFIFGQNNFYFYFWYMHYQNEGLNQEVIGSLKQRHTHLYNNKHKQKEAGNWAPSRNCRQSDKQEQSDWGSRRYGAEISKQ